MSRNKKIIIGLILALFLGCFTFFVGKIVKDRYFSPEKESSSQTNESETTSKSPDTSNESAPKDNPNSEEPDNPGEFLTPQDQADDQEAEKDLEEEEKEPTIKENFIDIKKKDCDNKCEAYEKNKEDYKYCRQVCGLSEIEKRSSEEECEDKEELDLDYCLRDLGISKKDYSICEKIEDAGISKMCRDRITEDIIDNNSTAE